MSTSIVNAFCAVMGERDNPAVEQPVSDPYNFAGDISRSLAIAAHAGSSFVPEKRGDQVRAGYAAELSSLYSELKAHATTPEKLATLDEEFARFREGYRKRYTAYLSSQSRTMSTMIAGPSNFPVRMMEKRNRVVDARRTELIEFLPRAKAAILKSLHPEWRPVMAGDGDAVSRLQEKIATAEAVQARMKSANAAIRKHKKAGAAAQVAALVELGFAEADAVKLLAPDFCGRIGFADYETTNNNANIRRMKERLTVISRNQAKEDTVIESGDIRLEDSPADNRVRLFFPGKPELAVREQLKGLGFRWSPTIGAWQAYRNWRTIEKAKEIAGLLPGVSKLEADRNVGETEPVTEV